MWTSCNKGKSKIPVEFLADCSLLKLTCLFWGFKFYSKYSFIAYTKFLQILWFVCTVCQHNLEELLIIILSANYSEIFHLTVLNCCVFLYLIISCHCVMFDPLLIFHHYLAFFLIAYPIKYCSLFQCLIASLLTAYTKG